MTATSNTTNEPVVAGTGTRATRVLGVATLAGVVALAVLGLVVSPEDVVQGDTVRLMYVHVPAAWLAYLSFFVTALGSVLYLARRTRSLGWDRLAAASAEVGLLFTGVCLVTGMVWGNLTWGVYWTWDARLTSTALLFVLFLGYIAVRRIPADPAVRARRCAVAGIVAFVDVPIVHMSVEWWRTLHQDASVLRPDRNVTLEDGMLFTLFVGVVVFTLAYVWLVMHRYRVEVLCDALDDKGVEYAIAERRAEAEVGLAEHRRALGEVRP